MFRSYRIGTLFGFPIEVNLSFLLVLGLLALTAGLASGLILALILFGSVLLHELGHAVVARRLGVQIAGIELHFFGGAAKMESIPKTANDEIAIAAAGPAVSLALGGLGLALGSVVGTWMMTYVGWINIILGVFNLLPALPMDGGRIMRALLTRKYTFIKATEVSIAITRGFAVLLGLYGLFTSNLYLALLAVLLWFLGNRELTMAKTIAHMFTYTPKGYHFRSPPQGPYRFHREPLDSDVEVLPADYWLRREAEARPQRTMFTRPPLRFRRTGFVIRQRHGRVYVEFGD